MSDLPPGPRRPSLIQMWEWIARPIPFLERCNRLYGDMFTVRFPVGTIVFISDPEVIKEIFTGDPDLLHAGEANATPLEPLMGKNSVLLLDGPEHMRQRKLMLPSFHGERMQRYGDLMREITEAEIRRWPVAEPFPLRPRTQAITLEIIMRALFGIEDAERLDQLRGRLGRLLDIGMKPTALASVVLAPLRKTIGRRTWDRFQRLRSDVDEVLYDEIARRRNAPDIAERGDVLSVLLQARDEQGKPLTDVELRDELITLLVAGHETTATTIAWAFDLLLRHPRELERLQDEIEGDEGDEYLDAVIKETLRIRPVVPGVVRKLTAPFEVGGRQFPAGIRLAPNIYLTHRRADVYPEPDRFNPERFLDRPADTYSWLPFGGGIRRCLGASFALYELKVVIPTIVRNVTLRAVGDQPEPIRRRAITFVPARDAMVRVERFHERAASAADEAPIAA
jgi:cytochrome P450 family 135